MTIHLGAWARPNVARFWSWVRARRPAAPASLAAGLRVYAIGDIHGYSDLLGRMADAVERDLARDPPRRALAVFLGDYVDRGPDSAGVIERLSTGDFPVPIVTLRGNHEAMMLDALDDPAAMATWCQCGGVATLRAYGVDPGKSAKALLKARTALIAALPAAHRTFLDRTELSKTIDDYFFVHAGARPGVPLYAQAPEDLLWIRDAFHGSAHDFGKVIVHGHTPRAKPENEPRRINVDTGAFKWGTLTGVALEGTERRFLDVRRAEPIRRGKLATQGRDAS